MILIYSITLKIQLYYEIRVIGSSYAFKDTINYVYRINNIYAKLYLNTMLDA